MKKNIIFGSFLLLSIIIAFRLLYLVIDPANKDTASNNVMKYEVVYPARGLIFDRNGEIIVSNLISYDISVTPREMNAFDTTEFCQIFKISREVLTERLNDINKRRRQIGFRSVSLIKQASAEEHALFKEKQYKFTGFSSIPRTIRSYPRNLGGNLLGYISEVDSAFLRRNPEYRQGDYTGITGIEQSYEPFLKGRKGNSVFLRNVHNQIVSSYNNGANDLKAIPGKDLVSTIDANLQEFAERLMVNKVGSIIAIEPQTGEILCMVSSPGIHVNQLANINKHFVSLATDPFKPMFNRAVMSSYPPGSVFKVVNGLIALQEGVITPETRFGCSLGYHAGGLTVGCHTHSSPTDLVQSIQMSCNAYYCNTFRAILDSRKYNRAGDALSAWGNHVRSFGLGQKLGSDFPSEQTGTIPTTSYYDRIYRSRWGSLTVISLSIGQGEIGATPLQLANLAAIIANRGYYITPHIIREIKDTIVDRSAYTQRHYTSIDPIHFEPVVEGMYLAVNGGGGSTARWSRLSKIELCGKTGTAENPHGNKRDHSVFICFAPRENPKIAIAVYVENAGFGATWAAPIASLVTEKYLTGTNSRTDLLNWILNGNLQNNVLRP
ncbi:MAG: penicillin-binding transpeptidase domain-containing protein [Bacteroidales bacterium]|nr:penicillin-binding transpeptidase domain-containing protein [Bacteroidales bacterium]